MNSLGIVARAVLMEAEEEGRGHKWARRAAIAGGVGLAGAAGLGALRGGLGMRMGRAAAKAKGRAKMGGYAAAIGRGAMQGLRHPINTYKHMAGRAAGALGRATGLSFRGAASRKRGLGFGLSHDASGRGFSMGYAPGQAKGVPGTIGIGLTTPNSYGIRVPVTGRNAAIGLGIGGAGYYAHHAYKQHLARKHAEAAYVQTFNAFMESDDDESSTMKWGKRAVGAGAALYGGNALLKGGRAAHAAYGALKKGTGFGKGLRQVAGKGLSGVKTGLMNPLKTGSENMEFGKSFFGKAKKKVVSGKKPTTARRNPNYVEDETGYG